MAFKARLSRVARWTRASMVALGCVRGIPSNTEPNDPVLFISIVMLTSTRCKQVAFSPRCSAMTMDARPSSVRVLVPSFHSPDMSKRGTLEVRLL